MTKLKKSYTIFITVLALISIILVILDYSSVIRLDASPWLYLDSSILIIFVLDYSTRLILAPNKKIFFKENIFDLIAIIPFNSLFSFFRISRAFRMLRAMRAAQLTKVLRMSRLVGVTGKLKNNASKFLKTNGLIYLIYISTAVLIFASILYSLAEKVPLGDAIWWAMTTATTVGDISPKTIIGRIATVLLMFVGIGFIGMLTSSITNYFIGDKTDQRTDHILRELQELKQQNKELATKIETIVTSNQQKNQ